MAIPQRMPHGDAVIEDCQKWIKEHYAVTNLVSGPSWINFTLLTTEVRSQLRACWLDRKLFDYLLST
jgi:hypothetical protein